MTRLKRRLIPLALVGLLLLAFFSYNPEPSFTPAEPAIEVSPEALAIHRSALVIDLHLDSLLWQRDLRRDDAGGQADLPRLRRGGVDAAAFTIPTRFFGVAGLKAFHDRWPPRAWFDPWARFQHQIEEMQSYVLTEPSTIRLLREPSDFVQNEKDGVLSVFQGIEGAHALGEDEGAFDRLPQLKKMGVLFVGPVHLSDNAYGGSSSGSDRGLTALGRRLLEQMNREGLLVDLAHASHRTFEEALSLTELPPLVSHAGVRGVHDAWRNLSDGELRAVGNKGGVIGVMLAPPALSRPNLAEAFQHLEHIVEVAGEDAAAIGSDFDGYVTPPIDAAGLPQLTELMLRAGWREERIRKILGGNALRVLSSAWAH